MEMIRNNRITALHFVQYDVLFDFDLILVFNATFSNISAISRRPHFIQTTLHEQEILFKINLIRSYPVTGSN
jgi:hypothetical protein